MLRNKFKVFLAHKNDPITRASVILTVVVFLVFIIETFFSYNTILEDAYKNTENLSKVLMEQINSSFEMTDEILDEFISDNTKKINSGDFNQEEINDWLHVRKIRTPFF